MTEKNKKEIEQLTSYLYGKLKPISKELKEIRVSLQGKKNSLDLDKIRSSLYE